MQVFAYTNEVVEKLTAYAMSLPGPHRQPRTPYQILHAEVFVPYGFLPIKIAQFRRSDPATRFPEQYHWAIFIPTSRDHHIGNYYELAEDRPSRYLKSTINAYNVRHGLEHGSHIIGFVDPEKMPLLEARLARTRLQSTNRRWGPQNWVYEALMPLNDTGMFYIGAPFQQLVAQMAIVAAAWEMGVIN